MIVDVFLTPNTFYSVIDASSGLNSTTLIRDLKLVHPNIKALIEEVNITYDELFQDNTIVKDNFLNIRSKFLYLKHVESIDDTKKLVFKKGKKYYYHLYKDCEGLNSLIYRDFKIPKDIVDRDDENLINIFRAWFKELLNEKKSLEYIVNKYNLEFSVKHSLSTVKEFRKVISQKDKLVLKSIKQNYFLGIRNPEVETLIKEVNLKRQNKKDIFELKERALELIYECFFWHIFSQDKHQDLSLEDFGLTHCKLCENRRQEEQRNKLINKANQM